jgi:predicted nucleic acid-binding protein
VSGFLLDTNVPSELTRSQSDALVKTWLEEADDEQLYLSVISLGELFKGPCNSAKKSNAGSISRRGLKGTLRSWFAGRILSITEGIAERWGLLPVSGSCAACR